MGFYTVLNAVHQLLENHHWHLHHCRRQGDDPLRYFVTDDNEAVLAASGSHRRVGMTLEELLLWLEQSNDGGLSAPARSMRAQIARAG